MSHAKRQIEEQIENEWREETKKRLEEILRLIDEGYEKTDVVQLLKKLLGDIKE